MIGTAVDRSPRAPELVVVQFGTHLRLCSKARSTTMIILTTASLMG